MTEMQDRIFYFHADASAFGGRITHPHEQVIEASSSCSLPQAGGVAQSAASTLCAAAIPGLGRMKTGCERGTSYARLSSLSAKM